MKKIIIGLLIIAILGIGAYFILKSPNWETYENSRYEFSVDYPSNWTLGEAPENNDGREFISPDEEISCHAYGFQNALINEQGNPQTLNEFSDWLIENLDIEEVLERNYTTLGGKEAQELITITNGTIARGVYTLGQETGRGLVCYYPDRAAMEKQNENFATMKKSFKINASLGNANDTECANLLSGVLIPFKDSLSFTDTEYTGVTMTSRDAWDRDRLPEQVVDLEDKGYTCSPLPLEFEGGEEENGVMPEPVVTEVQWDCELEYEDYKYLSIDEEDEKENLEKQGYICSSERCAVGGSLNNEGAVWLCTK